MTAIEQQQIVSMVYNACSQDPSFAVSIISSATEGVKEFALNQKDTTARGRALLVDILDNTRLVKLKRFDKKELFDHLYPFIGGTEGFEELKAKHAFN